MEISTLLHEKPTSRANLGRKLISSACRESYDCYNSFTKNVSRVSWKNAISQNSANMNSFLLYSNEQYIFKKLFFSKPTTYISLETDSAIDCEKAGLNVWYIIMNL